MLLTNNLSTFKRKKLRSVAEHSSYLPNYGTIRPLYARANTHAASCRDAHVDVPLKSGYVLDANAMFPLAIVRNKAAKGD